MARPNILVISKYSGSINAIRPEAEIFVGLIKMGFNITVITPKGEHYANLFEELGAEVIDYAPKSKWDAKAISLIKQTVKRKDIHIVHAFNSRSISCAAIALWWSNTILVGYRGYTGNIFWYDPSAYITFLNPRVNYMICLADSVREMFLKNGMSRRKAITIHKGHHQDWYSEVKPADLSTYDLPDGALVCSLVANNRTKMKGLHSLIRASHLLPKEASIYILLIGGGMETEEIKTLIKASPNPDRFIFTGFRSDASNLVKAVDVSISVSLFGEATQKAMIEALYLGNPVIISDIPGNRGMVIDGEGGFIVEPNNEQMIAEALLKFYNNRSEIPGMGQKAKQHIESFLSSEETIKNYASFYSSITSL